jgi:hypothetical protein
MYNVLYEVRGSLEKGFAIRTNIVIYTLKNEKR